MKLSAVTDDASCYSRKCQAGGGDVHEIHLCPLSINSNLLTPVVNRAHSKFKKFWNYVAGFLIFVSLIIIICILLEYQCINCEAKCNISLLNKNLEDIVENLAMIKKNYHDLELQISQFSKDLPKIEGQIGVLEALATTLELNTYDFKRWGPGRTQMFLPNVDVHLYQSRSDNLSDTNVRNDTKYSNSQSEHIIV